MREYSIGPITGLLKPRYKVITTILGENFIPDKGIDLFIDLNTLVSALSTSAKFLNSLPFSENVEADIISSVLMVVKHWKDFLRKYEDSRIFLIVNDFDMAALCEHEVFKSYLIPYVNKYQNDRFSQLVYYWTESIKRIEIVLNYVPKTYCIRTNRFDSYVLPNIIDDYSNNGRHRLIITGNSLMTNYSYMPRTKVIYTKYKKTGMSQISDPLMIVQSIAKIDEDIMSTFVRNKVFYNLLNAIIGDFDRGIIGLNQLGISSFANDLLRSVEKHEIPNDPMNVESVLPAIQTQYHDYLRKSYSLVDIESHSQLIQPSIIERTKSKLVDLYDLDGLRQLSVDGLNLIELI